MTKEEILKQLEELKKQVENIKMQENDGLWKPNMGEKFYYILFPLMIVQSTYWNNDSDDNNLYDYKLVFKTEEQAKEYLEYLKAKEKAMNEFSNEEWNNRNIEKWYYIYDYNYDYLGNTATFSCRTNIPYFRTQKQCQEFKNKYMWAIKREVV